MPYKTIFGPVHSRRLGLSLGLDLVKSKICSLDCIYCECGSTRILTDDRKEYVLADLIITELSDFLNKRPEIDYITFGGSGEPTLNTGMGRILAFIKNTYPDYKTALLTNGTLFNRPEVRKEALLFDVVLPSLDAVSDKTFIEVNHPVATFNNQDIIAGLEQFRREFKGIMWVEVFIVPGINDSTSELELFKESLSRIAPDRVQLNTLDRPGTCAWVKPATLEQLQAIAHFFSPLPVEIITRNSLSMPHPGTDSLSKDSILNLISRRPSTMEEIASACGQTINEIEMLLNTLLHEKMITAQIINKREFFKIPS